MAKVAAPNSPKTSESHQFRRNTSDVGGLGKPLGNSPAPSEIQSPRATAGRLCARPRARLEIFRGGACLGGPPVNERSPPERARNHDRYSDGGGDGGRGDGGGDGGGGDGVGASGDGGDGGWREGGGGNWGGAADGGGGLVGVVGPSINWEAGGPSDAGDECYLPRRPGAGTERAHKSRKE